MTSTEFAPAPPAPPHARTEGRALALASKQIEERVASDPTVKKIDAFKAQLEQQRDLFADLATKAGDVAIPFVTQSELDAIAQACEPPTRAKDAPSTPYPHAVRC